MNSTAEAAQARGALSSVGFNYRRTPALAYARRLVEEGAVGTVRHIRAHHLQDWIVDPEFPLVWRLQKDNAGSGALGAHVVDLSQFLTGQRLTEVSGHLTRFVERRPLAQVTSGLSASGGAESGEVNVDDAAVFFGRTDGGALATYEAPTASRSSGCWTPLSDPRQRAPAGPQSDQCPTEHPCVRSPAANRAACGVVRRRVLPRPLTGRPYRSPLLREAHT
ncbi:Gfo/Idh/MocA family protein [Micromonospora sp. NPDC007230]|uniref:Gfo/Idh/MocA family protein n=1 Tax=Micromonospora sp. NPDC007230 TaxID=3364237 RepID=UPI0036C1F4C9